MRNAIIIHGMPSKEEYYDPARPASSNCHWIPWFQKQLLLKDILTQTPEMPVPYDPEYQSWKEMFERFPLDEDTILVGHSCGAGFIVRYLSENDVKVGTVVLVAPWLDLEKSLDTGMFDFELDPDFAERTAGVTIFASTDDMESVQETVALLAKKARGVTVTEFKDYGHFCYSDMGTDAFPELLDAVA